MPVSLSFTIGGEKQVMRDLQRFRDGLEDPRPAFEEIRLDFYRIERLQFDSQGAYGSGGWAPLKPSTVAQKIKRGLDPRVLHETRALRNSLIGPHRKGSRGRVVKDELILGTDLRSRSGFPYPIVHQRGNRTTPRRPPIEIPEQDRRKWVKIMQRYLVNAMRAGDRSAR